MDFDNLQTIQSYSSKKSINMFLKTCIRNLKKNVKRPTNGLRKSSFFCFLNILKTSYYKCLKSKASYLAILQI